MNEQQPSAKPPLAERMRPQGLDSVVGQEHLTAPGKVLHRMVATGNLPSMIFWGPPGVGKTTLARVLAAQTGKPFYGLSAISSGVKDVRDVIAQAKECGGAILFIDEIHRFSKSQQDSLLGAVEEGALILIGATTENPSFEVISALLSRCQVYKLESVSDACILTLLQKAIENDQFLIRLNIELKETNALLQLAGGDARKALNLLEIVAEALSDGGPVIITDQEVMNIARQKIALYDKAGEQHYDIISAFIKSIRGSDPNAAVYWLARMIEGGEDPVFIARRLLILASEDIGNANPNALLLANACFQAVTQIGYPECGLTLSQTVIYLATSPKSNSAYLALKTAQEVVRQTGDLSVPLHLRNAPTKLMKNMNYGQGYRYAHDYEGNFVEQEFLPEKISGKQLYVPGKNAREEELRKFLSVRWKKRYGY